MSAREPKGKGALTRARILEAALELFRERGYSETTMRLVAQRAGVSVGNAYYYFRSKEHLIHEYYSRSQADHRAAAGPRLAGSRTFRARLRGAVEARLDTAEPYHEFAQQLFRTAADPRSPLSPFSAESKAPRAEAVALMDEVVRGSNARVPEDLAAELPRLLWLYLMGIILFWVHDDSPERRRTRLLVERSTELIARLVRLASNPLLSPLRRQALSLVRLLDEPA